MSTKGVVQVAASTRVGKFEVGAGTNMRLLARVWLHDDPTGQLLGWTNRRSSLIADCRRRFNGEMRLAAALKRVKLHLASQKRICEWLVPQAPVQELLEVPPADPALSALKKG